MKLEKIMSVSVASDPTRCESCSSFKRTLLEVMWNDTHGSELSSVCVECANKMIQALYLRIAELKK